MSFHPLTFGLFVSYPSVLYLLCFSLSVPPLLPYFLGRRQEHRRLGGSQGHRLDSLLCHHVAVRPQHMLPAIWASCLSSPQDLPENPPPPARALFLLLHWPHQAFILQQDLTHATPASPLPRKCPLSVTALSTRRSCALHAAPAVLDWT